MASTSVIYRIIARDDASKQFGKVGAETDKLRKQLERLDRQRVEIKVNARTAKARADIEKLAAFAKDQKIRMKIDVDNRRAMTRLAALSRSAESAGSSVTLLGASILPLAAMAVPALAAVTAATVALGGALTGAVMGAGALALVAVPAFKKIGEASKAQAALNQAVATYGPKSSQAATATKKLHAAMAALSPAEQGLAGAFGRMKSAFSGWQKSLEPTVLPVFTKALSLVKPVLDSLTPVVRGAAAGFDRLVSYLRVVVTSPGWQAFGKTLGLLAKTAIPKLGMSLLNLVQGFGNLITAFRPFTNIVLNGLQNLTAKFKQWSSTLGSSPGFHRFIDYVKTNGPKLMSMLGSVARAFGHILVSLAPLGPPLMNMVKHLADFISRVPPSVLRGIAVGIASVAGAVFVGTRAMKAVSLATKVWSGAMKVLNLVMKANPILAIIGLIILLGTWLVHAYKTSKTFRDIVNGAFHAVQAAGKFMWNNVLKPVFKFLIKAWLTVAGAIVHGAAKAFGWVPGLGPKLKHAARWFDDFKNKVNGALDGVKNKHVEVTATGKWHSVLGGISRNSYHSSGAGVNFNAAGGYISGPGTATSDSIPAMLSNGEYVVRAASVRRYGTGMLHAINAGHFAAGGLVVDPRTSTGTVRPDSSRWYNSRISEFARQIAAQMRKLASAAGTGTQRSNAAIIAAVGRAMGFGHHGIVVALMTALQESGLRNLNYGDRDSLGLFQQRPSQGWGSPAQVRNPAYAAAQFFGHLRGVSGWRGMPYTMAAQSVQRSAFPYAYAKWRGQAEALAAGLGYDNGGPLLPGWNLAYNGTGRPENVRTAAQEDSLLDEVRALRKAVLSARPININEAHRMTVSEIVTEVERRLALRMG